MPENVVTFFQGDTATVKSELTPKNLGWVIQNMRHIEIVKIGYGPDNIPSLYIAGNRNGDVFVGYFPFSKKEVLIEWCEKRKHFQHVGVENNF